MPRFSLGSSSRVSAVAVVGLQHIHLRRCFRRYITAAGGAAGCRTATLGTQQH